MNKAAWFVILTALGIVLIASAVAAADKEPPANSGSWLGADPGYGMRSWEDLYPGLDLTPDQKRQLADIRVETLQQVCAARDDLKVPAQERMQNIAEARKVGRERELAVLTPEQREYMQQHPPARSPLFDRQNWAERVATPPAQRPHAPRNSAGLVPGLDDLTDEQTNRIAAIRAETQRQVRAVQQDRSLTPQQRSARVRQIQEQGHQEVLGVLTPAQRQRFDQAMRSPGHAMPDRQVQSRGGTGAGRGTSGQRAHPGQIPGVSNLSTAQMNAIAAIRAETRRQIQAVQNDRTLTPQQRSTRISEIQQRNHERVMAVLTEEQRTSFRNWWMHMHGPRSQ